MKKTNKTHRYNFKLNEAENVKFLNMLDLSGAKSKSHFIIARIFGWEFKVVKIDKGAIDYYIKLSTFYNQFRAIGQNYNQVVKEMHANFTERKALAHLYKLEKYTLQIEQLSREIVALTNEFRERWLGK